MRSALLSLALAAAAAAQTNYLQNAEAGMQALQQWYQSNNGVWQNIGWWNSANAMTTVANLASIDSNFKSNASNVFYNSWVHGAGNKRMLIKRESVNGGVETEYGPVERLWGRDSTRIDWKSWTDKFYDDNSWWALAWIAAYDAGGDPDYLTMAEAIFDNNISNAGPTNCNNGGVWWNTDKSYANAITNELYFSVAAHLAARTTPDKKQGYLTTAQNQLAWFNASGMINAQGTINDGLNSNCQNNGGPVFSYNQGVILGGLVELQKAAASPTNAYLTQAASIAKAAITALADPTTHVMHESCDQANTCSSDETQFKGIFMRNLAQLQLAAPDDEFKTFITANADSIWNNARSSSNTFAENWSGPDANSDNASTTSSALDAIVAAAAITAQS